MEALGYALIAIMTAFAGSEHTSVVQAPVNGASRSTPGRDVVAGVLYQGEHASEQLCPVVRWSDGKWEKLTVDSGFGPQDEERARGELSRLQAALTGHREFALFDRGEQRGVFRVSNCEMSFGHFCCAGERVLRPGLPLQEALSFTGVALSPPIPQKALWTTRLTPTQEDDLGRATKELLGRAGTFIPGQHQTGQQSVETVAMDLDQDGRPEVFRRVQYRGQPCSTMSTHFLGSWTGSRWVTLKSSIYLALCPQTLTAGEDYFSPRFADIDGDGRAEIFMYEGRWEASDLSLYRLVGGALRLVFRIGSLGL